MSIGTSAFLGPSAEDMVRSVDPASSRADGGTKRARYLSTPRSDAASSDPDFDDAPPDFPMGTVPNPTLYHAAAARRLERSPQGSAYADFRRGNIVRLEMVNFLTFSNTVLDPGPRMNLVLGPNGTGKSTIVNAVCIVFGGSPRLLGRNPDLGSFVRHGSADAAIEAWICDPERPSGVRRIRREFNSDGKGRFLIDGKKAKLSDVQKSVNDEYEIQLDNLSQFMPQEKIAEFVNFKADELLQITVRSLGGAEKESKLHQLITTGEETGKFEELMERREQVLRELIIQNEAVEGEVQAYREAKAIKARISRMKKYLPRVQADELKLSFIVLLKGRKDQEAAVEQIEAEMQLICSGPMNACTQEFEAAGNAVKAAKVIVTSRNDLVIKLIGDSEELTNNLASKTSALGSIDEKVERQSKVIQQSEAKLQFAVDDLAMHNDGDGDVDAKRRESEQTRNRLRTDIRTEESSKVGFEQIRMDAARVIEHHSRSLHRLGDVRQQRVQALDRMTNGQGRGTFQCTQLVAEMKSQNAFRGQVYGPVAAEISCNDQYHARIMESTVSGFLMTAFVTESAADSRTLIHTCKQRFKGWAPDVITAPTDKHDVLDVHAFQAQVPQRPVDDKLRNLGILAMVSDIFKAPDVVRAALNAQAGLHNIHVGDEIADQRKEELRYEDGVQAWYTPTARCQVIRSRYDPSVRNLKVDSNFSSVRGNIYSGKVDEVEQQRQSLTNTIRDHEERMKQASQQLAVHDDRVKSFNEKLRTVEQGLQGLLRRRRDREAAQAKVNQLRQCVARVKDNSKLRDTEVQKAVLYESIQNVEVECVDIAPQVLSGLTDLRDALARFDDLAACKVVAERNLAAEKAKNSELDEQLQCARDELSQKRDDGKAAKRAWKNMERQAKQILPDEELERNKNEYDEFVERTVEWIEEEIERQKGRMDGLVTGGEIVVDRYEHNLNKIANETRAIADERASMTAQIQTLETEKSEFLLWLRNGIEHMRTKFSSLYKRLGCSGDLELVNAQSKSMSDIALQVLVSYRDDSELRPISATANSGGEKMCCTMLFCFSLLQDEERMPPFVMVDELNQGLDPVNEMKIMTMMFEDAEKGSAPQSFVITPKLLLNLPFQPNTKNHIIFNGTVTGGDITAPQS